MTNCQKDELNGTSGQIIDAATQKGIPNAIVALNREEQTVLGPIQQTFLEETTTNDLGEFTFEYQLKSSSEETYSINIVADRYYASNFNSFPRNKIVEMTPETIVRLYLKNIPPTHSLDKISVNSTFEGGGGGPFKGGNVDTLVSGKVRGNRDIRIIWFVKTAGESSVSNQETIFAKWHDTIYYEILY